MSLFSFKCNSPLLLTLYVMVPYTSSVKPKEQKALLRIFALHSLAVAYLHTSISLGHSKVDATDAWEV